MKTSTFVVIGIVALAGAPAAWHLAGGSKTGPGSSLIKVLHGGGSAMHGTPQATSITGKWTVTVAMDDGHDALSSLMVLKQDGRKISGTFTNPHDSAVLPLTGERTDGKLTMAVEAKTDHGGMHLAFTGSVKDDGTLAGTLTSVMGESKWTATRVVEK